ncbi:DUF1345 domain-containing protein [Phormidesmis priestleyi]
MPPKTHQQIQLSPKTRLVSAIAVALLVFFLLPSSLRISTRLLSTWAAGVSCLLMLTLLMMYGATAEMTRDRSQSYKISRISAVALILIAISSCVFAIGALLSSAKNSSFLLIALHLGLTIVSIACSWFLVHLMFAQQYAALYYYPNSSSQAYAGGLRFAEDITPDYWDFLYFAFVLGATAQTSDTFIVSRPMRRLVLVQTLLAFFFFVGILATSINVGSALLQSN